MTINDTAAAPRRGLRIYLTVAAAVHLVFTIVFPILVWRARHNEFAWPADDTFFVLRPLLALAALIPAALGRVRLAIVILALLALGSSLFQLVSLYRSGFLASSIGAFSLLFNGSTAIYPVIAVAALWLAWRNTRLAVAAVLATLPIILRVGFWVGLVALALVAH